MDHSAREENGQTCHCICTQKNMSRQSQCIRAKAKKVSIFKDLIDGYFSRGHI